MKSKLICGSLQVSQYIYIYSQLFTFGMVAILGEESWHTSLVMSPAELPFYMPQKGVDQSKDRKSAVIRQLWSASGDRLTGQLSPGCLADSR